MSEASTASDWSVWLLFLVLLITLLLTGWGLIAVKQTPLDAIPDLSDVQVIIRTTFPGQSPRVVEEQVTYPITTTMLAVPGAQAVRGYSFFGDSYVYVIFEDGTDIYWARSRVLEYLNQAAADLPAGSALDGSDIAVRNLSSGRGLVEGDTIGELEGWTLAAPLAAEAILMTLALAAHVDEALRWYRDIVAAVDAISTGSDLPA